MGWRVGLDKGAPHKHPRRANPFAPEVETGSMHAPDLSDLPMDRLTNLGLNPQQTVGSLKPVRLPRALDRGPLRLA